MDFFLNEILEDEQVKQYIEAHTERFSQAFFLSRQIADGLTYEKPDGELALFTLASMADAALKKMLERGIPRIVAVDTLRDINLWIRNHRKVYGTIGVMEFDWLLNHYHHLNIVRLGRLQYQLREKDGETVLDTHVPQDEPLTTEACLASFEMAKQFFVKDHPTRLICHSWLLCPRLAELLPAESNIIRFMQLWTQEPCKPDNSVQAMERIFGFGFTADRLADAPEDSSLQRKAKRYLLDGGRLDACAGYIVL